MPSYRSRPISNLAIAPTTKPMTAVRGMPMFSLFPQPGSRPSGVYLSTTSGSARERRAINSTSRSTRFAPVHVGGERTGAEGRLITWPFVGSRQQFASLPNVPDPRGPFRPAAANEALILNATPVQTPEPENPACVHGAVDSEGDDMTQGKSWTVEETEHLRRHIMQGGSAVRAAVIFRRTVPAVRSCARTLGLSFPTIAQLRRSAGSPPLVNRSQSRQPGRPSFRERQAMESSAGDE